ncbi:MAG TPA: peptidoglycan bridge formation glycyltransferase FemA/FemB family protein [Ktedonobacteraceae bacterium]|jgi:lipid II:glycine glycyltransferase (peptidoglycan interpeptide bridge formation enzyme)
MIRSRYLLQEITSSQRTLWDTFLYEHPYGHLLQSWRWGELKQYTGWQPVRLALWDQDEQRIVAGAQVLRYAPPHIPLRLGHLAYVPKGPVLDWTHPELCDTFFTQLHRWLRVHGALALRVEPPVEAGTPEGKLVHTCLNTSSAHSIHPMQPLRTIVVDLQADDTELRARLKDKTRYNIGLAARRGVTIRAAQTLDDVRNWYRLLHVTGKRDQFGIHAQEYYLRAWELLREQEYARLFLAEHEGELLAGIFVSAFAHEGIYLYGASSNERRNLMPNYLLQWEAMLWARSQGARHYDLWGIPDTDDTGEAMAGVYRFKRGWGGRVVQFTGCYEYVYHPLAMHLAQHFILTG